MSTYCFRLLRPAIKTKLDAVRFRKKSITYEMVKSEGNRENVQYCVLTKTKCREPPGKGLGTRRTREGKLTFRYFHPPGELGQ